jgi:DNA-binding NtrC family response regulator
MNAQALDKNASDVNSERKNPMPSKTESISKADQIDIDLLIVDDEADFRESACRYFDRKGFRVDHAEDGEEALNVSTNKKFDVVVLDIHMPGMNGIQVLEEFMKRDPAPKVIMLTGGGTIENAVESIKKGAYDFLTKPVKIDDLARLITRACETHQLEKENQQLKEVIKRQVPEGDIIGRSPAMQEVSRLIERTAASDQPVLIQGESGTGKELVARAIHQASPLADMPLVVINCAALAEQLLESELFGHEKGSFTGAVATKPGLVEIADGGTLFIDEFGEMSGALQAKLLRVLEDGSMRRVGSITERHVNVRVIAATNRDLEQEVKDKTFREDLYYRINVLGISLPPLRERTGDIQLLAEKFAGDDWIIDDDVMQRLTAYSWPGNVRQLQNAIERAKVLAEENRIELKNLPPAILDSEPEKIVAAINNAVDLETLNRIHVEETYNRNGKNKTRTARALGINRRSLYRLLEKYEIS